MPSWGRLPGSSLMPLYGLYGARSIRLKFDPYHPLPFVHTRIVGKVVRRDAPEIPLQGAQVRLTHVNSAGVVLQEIVGARIATVAVNATEPCSGLKEMWLLLPMTREITTSTSPGTFLQMSPWR